MNRMRENMKPSNSNFQKEDAFFAELLAGQFCAAALFFAIMVALSKNQHSPQGYVRNCERCRT